MLSNVSQYLSPSLSNFRKVCLVESTTCRHKSQQGMAAVDALHKMLDGPDHIRMLVFKGIVAFRPTPYPLMKYALLETSLTDPKTQYEALSYV